MVAKANPERSGYVVGAVSRGRRQDTRLGEARFCGCSSSASAVCKHCYPRVYRHAPGRVLVVLQQLLILHYTSIVGSNGATIVYTT